MQFTGAAGDWTEVEWVLDFDGGVCELTDGSGYTGGFLKFRFPFDGEGVVEASGPFEIVDLAGPSYFLAIDNNLSAGTTTASGLQMDAPFVVTVVQDGWGSTGVRFDATFEMTEDLTLTITDLVVVPDP